MTSKVIIEDTNQMEIQTIQSKDFMQRMKHKKLKFWLNNIIQMLSNCFARL